MATRPRRIVTGHDKNGKSIVVSDSAPPNEFHVREHGITFFEIWNTDQSPAPVAPTEAEPTDRPVELAPKPNGTVIRILDFSPGFSEKQAGIKPFMHRTETIDYGIVLEGDIVLLLSDSEVSLTAGDVVVQRGTDHAWENRSDRPTRMAFILIDGAFTGELKRSFAPGALTKVIRGPLGARSS
jgi:Cupin domain